MDNRIGTEWHRKTHDVSAQAQVAQMAYSGTGELEQPIVAWMSNPSHAAPQNMHYL